MKVLLRQYGSLVMVLLLAVLALWWVWPSSSDSADPASTVSSSTVSSSTVSSSTVSSSTVSSSTDESSAVATSLSGLSVVTLDELPVEALETLLDIARGGPYRFDQDDTVFQNREGILPDRERGYYREYTVVTSGEDDRGARRIVVGAGGEMFYTDDHYGSFREIVT